MKTGWKKYGQLLKSYFRETEIAAFYSQQNKRLSLAYIHGHLVLNNRRANYSYGNHSKVFRSVFHSLEPGLGQVKTVLILGAGAGGVIDILRNNHLPDAEITAVEHDPMILQIGKNYFNLAKWKSIEIIESDAMDFMHENHKKFDLVVVDLFNDVDVPEIFLTGHFYALLREALTGSGMLVFNLLTYNDFYKSRHEELISFLGNYPGEILNFKKDIFNELVVWKKL